MLEKFLTGSFSAHQIVTSWFLLVHRERQEEVPSCKDNMVISLLNFHLEPARFTRVRSLLPLVSASITPSPKKSKFVDLQEARGRETAATSARMSQQRLGHQTGWILGLSSNDWVSSLSWHHT
jgi:hypothetical protein